MSAELIPVFRPWYDTGEVSAVSEVLRSGWIGLGPRTAAFERAFAAFLDVPHAVAVNSGTAALHLACILAGIGPGDEVIVPALTFASTALAPRYCGARIVFADVEEETLTIDAADVARKITRATKAIIPVHYGGTPADLEALEALARQHELLLIEDAAHACGGVYHGRKIGARGHLAAFSFHAVKNLATADGGMVIPRSDAEGARLRALRWVGIDKDTWARENQSERRYDWYYEIREVGFKYQPTDIMSALGLVQLEKVAAANSRRRARVAQYREALRAYPWVRLLGDRPGAVSACHNFVVRVPEREAFRLFLAERMISTGVHYTPLTQQPVFREFSAALPVTDRVVQELVTLPLYPGLTDADMDRILEAIRAYHRALRRAAVPSARTRAAATAREP